MVIAVNGTLVTGATGAGDGHQRCTRDRGVNQQDRDQADQGSDTPGRGVCVHGHTVQFNCEPFLNDTLNL